MAIPNSTFPDSRLIADADLEQYLVDKDTGFPLAAGVVTFYRDVNRTELKSVYQLTGSPGAYTFAVLENPLTLSAVGTFQDELGNNIVPYYFPYEGTPDIAGSTGEIDLYFVTVSSSDSIFQFDREAWPPNVTATDVNTVGQARNFIPNGQFLAHTQIVGANQPPFTTVSGVRVQPIAQGGWTFQRSVGGASTFENSFITNLTAISGLNDYPRFSFNYKCTSFDSSDTRRELVISWGDVNKFASGNPPGDQDYTLFFSAESLDVGSYTFDVRLIRYYGTGGSPSPTTDESLFTIIVTPTLQYFVRTFEFPANNGTVGTNNDDYISIAFRGPASSANAVFTDFSSLFGNINPQFFPISTNANMLSQSIAGWVSIPNPDGSDLYLKPQLTPAGMQWDHSEIGEIRALTHTLRFNGSISTETNSILCDGSAHVVADYSELGIPFSRLWANLWDDVTVLPSTGTGYNFVTTYIPTGTTNIVRLTTNKSGSQTAAADGANATGFTFTPLFTGNTAYALNTYISATVDTLVAMGQVAGAITAAAAGTSGFTVSQIYNDTLLQQLFTVEVTGAPAAGTYFTFSNTVPTNYYVWFTIDGAGADPAPGGTGILVPLLSTYATSDISAIIREACAGYQGVNITTVAGAGIPAGAYFTFSANSAMYAPWYEVAGLGTEPSIGATNIKVSIAGTETAAQIALATQLAINSYQYAVPNLKGVILSGWNEGVANIPGDLLRPERFSLNSIYQSTTLNSYQWQTYQQHFHDYSYKYFAAAVSNGPDLAWFAFPPDPAYDGSTVTPVTSTGSAQNRPFNYSVNYVIKY